jgi:hypothetical protein
MTKNSYFANGTSKKLAGIAKREKKAEGSVI